MRTYHVKIELPDRPVTVLSIQADRAGAAIEQAERRMYHLLTYSIEPPHETQLRTLHQESLEVADEINQIDQFCDDPGDTIEQCGREAYNNASARRQTLKPRQSTIWAEIHTLESTKP